MIISPPFLPESASTNAMQSAAVPGQLGALHDRAFLKAAFQATDLGFYPISYGLQWHNGVHLKAPQNAAGNGYLPVRAIADGEVIKYVKPEPSQSSDPKHPQNYNPFGDGPAWTDKGMLILKHTTEIGAAGTTPTQIEFYSVYMHLSRIESPIVLGQTTKVYRKDKLGETGKIYGEGGLTHFEICCDEANLKKILGAGRSLDWQDITQAPTADGRTDAVFGSMYVYLPAGTATATGAMPANHMRQAGSATLGTAQWVQITYDRGQGILTSYDTNGQPIGVAQNEADGEYKLYTEANRRHAALDATNIANSSPSGWFEMLRFGRNLGRSDSDKDPLPATVAHWRKISTSSGVVWADLNAEGSYKFSDADFPAIMGWQCIQDDTSPNDQRCDSNHIKTDILLAGNADSDALIRLVNSAKDLAKHIQEPSVAKKLAKTICKFPTEFDQSNYESRYQWIKNDEVIKQNPDDWTQLAAHIEALTCADLPQTYKDAQWHFNPIEFVTLMRKCSWVSEVELSRIYPDNLYPVHALSLMNKDPSSIREQYRKHINNILSKYLIYTPTRKTHFFGQGAVESMYLVLMVEGAANFSRNPQHASFASEAGGYYNPAPGGYLDYLNNRLGNIEPGDGPKFRGRGMKQLTGRENYSKYWVYRAWLDPGSFKSPWWNPPRPTRAPQIPDPQKLSIDDFNAIDAGGWYWEAGSNANGNKSINDVIEDGAIGDSVIETVTRAINGATNGLEERKKNTKRIAKILLDSIN